MSQYFDRDFFRFFLGFATIISISLTVILITKIYASESEFASTAPTPSIQSR